MGLKGRITVILKASKKRLVNAKITAKTVMSEM